MNFSWLSNYRDFALLFLRVALGAMMVCFGWPKLAGGLPGWEKLGGAMGNLGIHFFPGFWGFSSAMVETIGGALLIIGLWFRPVCLLMTMNFVVATLLVYKTSGIFKDWTRPGELLVIFFCLMFLGAGRYSVDRS